jgi:hypothetical protein
MPIRVEEWLVNEKIKYSIHGIAWGGSRPVTGLQIRFNAEEDFVSVNDFRAPVNDPWSFWTHPWTPVKPGVYFIQLKVKDVGISSKRLEAGHYVRSVEVTEI